MLEPKNARVSNLPRRNRKAGMGLPFLAAILIASLALSLSQFLSQREENQIVLMTQTSAVHIHRQIESELESRMLAIERISERWAANGDPTKNAWDAEAKLYVRHYPGIQAVLWIDPFFHARWVEPYEHNQYLLESPLDQSPGLKKALETARNRNRSVLTETMDLPRGGKGFYVYSPIYLSRHKEFHGYTGGIFRTEKLFKLILANMATDFSVKILDEKSQDLFVRDAGSPAAGREDLRWGQTLPLEMRGIHWSIRVWPTLTTVQRSLSMLPVFVLCGGMLLAALFGGIVYLLELTRVRAFRIERINFTLKQQMLRRRAAQAALRETGERLHLALKSSGMGTWRLDLQKDVMSWDDYMHPLFGLASGALQGGYEDFLEKIHPEDREEARRKIAEAVETSSDYDTRYRILLPDGSERHLASRGRVHYDKNGLAAALTGVSWDITEQNKAEEMTRYAEVLKRSNEELERFAYVASHDLKSPLNNIVRYTELLMNPPPNTPETAGVLFLERMHKAAVRMAALIDRLLDYSRAETEAQKLEPVELGELFAEITADLESHIQKYHGTVEVGPLPFVTGDKIQLRQLFQNLIANAIKFHAPDRPPKVVITSVKSGPTAVQVRIQDNGIGIDAKHQKQIFKPFHRLHRQDEYEGSGIGLATCQRIIQRHGGHIEIESRLGEGTAFLVTLPASQHEPSLRHSSAA